MIITRPGEGSTVSCSRSSSFDGFSDLKAFMNERQLIA